jgi:hypothetical protein
MMGFEITEDVSEAEAIAGSAALDEDSLKAVRSGIPYVGYTSDATECIQESLLPEIQTDWTEGVDCLGYVTYPDETLTKRMTFEEIQQIMRANLEKLNSLIPSYSKVANIEVQNKPFEKTPKKSIKRFLYK